VDCGQAGPVNFKIRMLLNLVCFCLYVFGIHTVFGVPMGDGAPFPFILCAVASLLALPCVLPYLLRLRLSNCWPMVAYLLLATVITAVAAEPSYYARSLRGILQLYYSVALATCLFWVILSIPRQKLASVCLLILVVLALASLLEFLGPLRDISDRFREIASPNWGYDANERDLAMHGAVRTKVFSPEPSIAATTFFWVSMMFFWSATMSFRQFLLWLTPAIIMLWTNRSPTLIAAIACCGFTYYALEFIAGGKRFLTNRNLSVLAISAGVVAAIVIGAYSLFEERFASILSGEGSFAMRETGALQFAGEYVTQHPFIGTGVVGDFEMLTDDIVSLYHSLGVDSQAGMDLNTSAGSVVASKGLTNDVAIHFTYFGGIGGIIEAALLIAALYLCNRWLWALVLLDVFAFSMSGGGYNGPPIWFIGFSLLAVAKLKEASLREAETGPAWPNSAMSFSAPDATYTHIRKY
jgi:hypothetical protein